MDTDRGCLLTEDAGVFTDQHVRNTERGEARVDREQLGLVRNAEHHRDGSRRSGATLAGGVRDVGGEKALRQVLADDYKMSLGDAARRGTRSGVSLRKRRELTKELSVNGSTWRKSYSSTCPVSRPHQSSPGM